MTPPSVTANVVVHLWVECPNPNCREALDLLDQDDCEETGSIDARGRDALTAWMRNEPHTPIVGTCDRCDKEFTLGGIEW